MRLLIHDLEQERITTLLGQNPPDDIQIISDDQTIAPCLGCFGCWVKTPAACVIRDAYGDMGEIIARCSEIVLVSECVYGSYSPFVKNVLDRSISYILPDFRMLNGEMHHKMRYRHTFALTAWFYGGATEQEKRTAERLVKANTENLGCTVQGVHFVQDAAELEGKIV